MAELLNIDSFVGKWQAREPEMAIAEVFCPPADKLLFRNWGALLNELREACFELSDARVTAVKVGWWAEEFLGVAKGAHRHPLTGFLVSHNAPWSPLARALLAFVSEEKPLSSDLPAVLIQLEPLAQAVIACEDELFSLMNGKQDPIVDTHSSEDRKKLEEQVFTENRMHEDRIHGNQAIESLSIHWLTSRLLTGLSQADRPFIPLNLLARHGVSIDTLIGESADAKVNAAKRDLAQQLAASLPVLKKTHDHQSLFRTARSNFDQQQLNALIAGKPARLPPWRTLWLAWRSARQCR